MLTFFFCHHLSIVYVELSNHYANLSEKYYDKQLVAYYNILLYSLLQCNAPYLTSRHNFLTSKRNFNTSGHNDLTSRQNDLKSSFQIMM